MYIVILFNFYVFVCDYMYINEKVYTRMLTMGSTAETQIMSRFSLLPFPNFLQCICIPFVIKKKDIFAKHIP